MTRQDLQSGLLHVAIKVRVPTVSAKRAVCCFDVHGDLVTSRARNGNDDRLPTDHLPRVIVTGRIYGDPARTMLVLTVALNSASSTVVRFTWTAHAGWSATG
jgi:hypothetical protein